MYLRITEIVCFIIGMMIIFRHEPGWVPIIGGSFIWLGISTFNIKG